MSIYDRDKLNRIEELKGQLFGKNYKTKIEHRDSFTHFKRKDIPDSWGDEGGVHDDSTFGNRVLGKTPIFRGFFIFSVIFFILTVAYASYVFFAGGNTVSNNNIDISVLGNDFVAGGEELSLVIGITNKNSSPLDLVDLIIEYPKGSADSNPDSPNGTERIRSSIGTIPAGAVHNENVKLILFGQQGSERPIDISIEYRVEGSNAIFVKEKFYEVTLSSTPVDFSLDAPFSVSPNQDVTLDATLALNATRPLSKMLLRFDYPVGFKFTSATPPPSSENNVWDLGDIAPGAERKISIVGQMVDVFDGEEKTFHASTGSQSPRDKSKIDTVFNSLSHTIAIKKPFIETRLFVNGVSSREYAVDSKSPVFGEIRWTNNLDTKVNDLQIKAKILGDAVNKKTINAKGGFYNSAENMITWDRNSSNKFKEVNPGDTGAVSFSVAPSSLFSATAGLLSDPTIDIEISISGKEQVEGFETRDLNNSESATIRIISDVGLTAKGLYYSGPFTNTGPIPPQVEKETTYTVVWSVSNTANNISKATVRSVLPPWVRFIGPASPVSEDLTHNVSTKEVTWNVGRISKGTGVTATSQEVAFRVGLIPSLSQLGAVPAITSDVTLTGYDDFAKVDVRTSKGPVYIRLDDDPEFPSSGGVVVE